VGKTKADLTYIQHLLVLDCRRKMLSVRTARIADRAWPGRSDPCLYRPSLGSLPTVGKRKIGPGSDGWITVRPSLGRIVRSVLPVPNPGRKTVGWLQDKPFVRTKPKHAHAVEKLRWLQLLNRASRRSERWCSGTSNIHRQRNQKG
jgi:hypothetical protein